MTRKSPNAETARVVPSVMTLRRTLLAAGAASTMAALVPGAVRAAASADAAGVLSPSGRTIVIFFSRTDHTATLAERAAQKLGCELLRLELREPYASDYGDMTDIAREEKRSGKRREIATAIPDLAAYDTVYLGSPYWWGGISVPVMTFLADHPLAGKRVKPFVVSASSGPSGAWADLRKACPEAKLEEGFHTTESSLEGSLDEFDAWLAK
ncbi:flavodoxin [Sutterella megalosphaeroides]|uniref:Flavodoxin-like domain-containing protein n=1 Tax=Sutterella megalosphaeroides TaxID=2494234 RepID=A0A2Z6IBF8_9BURK|nr:flavodoxin [Sutterella megalosphaeroides]BBF23602.1 hypothetical protein SUTMEG_14930 [Sutterella megalosphaeroides]